MHCIICIFHVAWLCSKTYLEQSPYFILGGGHFRATGCSSKYKRIKLKFVLKVFCGRFYILQFSKSYYSMETMNANEYIAHSVYYLKHVFYIFAQLTQNEAIVFIVN